ncbi:HNH endonuclease family protein [Spiroplasma endosymbiont of Eupeodes luniger]|uniref:HNH endonuclease family protein n=1 Tax=Spiroplasma endosymbiont of Eupeodes luniger TaxID=3066300 RepID=UPI0030CA9F7E
MNSYFSDVKKISQEIIDYERGYEDNNIIKWYLYSILTYSYENEDISFHNINLEHIMPIKYKEWETKDKFWKNKEHSIEDYIYKLGNCTLLHEKLNKSISNKIFSEKCEKLFNRLLAIPFLLKYSYKI